MTWNQIQYRLKAYESGLAKKTPSVLTMDNSGTDVSPLGMTGAEEETRSILN